MVSMRTNSDYTFNIECWSMKTNHGRLSKMAIQTVFTKLLERFLTNNCADAGGPTSVSRHKLQPSHRASLANELVAIPSRPAPRPYRPI